MAVKISVEYDEEEHEIRIDHVDPEGGVIVLDLDEAMTLYDALGDALPDPDDMIDDEDLDESADDDEDDLED